MRRLLWCSVALLLVAAAGCGYRFSGGGDFPFGIKKIFVPMFANRTGEIGVEHIVTNDFIYEFTRSDKVEVADKESADAILSGVVATVSTETVSRTGSQNALERRVTVYLDLSLADRRGNVLWAVKRVSDDETYEVQSIKLSTERRKLTAIKVLSRRMAETVYNLLTDIE